MRTEHPWWKKGLIRGLQESTIISLGIYTGASIAEPNREVVALTALGCAIFAVVVVIGWYIIEMVRER